MGRIVIVGASSGIGYQTAKLFILEGWKTVVAARRTENLQSLKQLNPQNVEIAMLDITSDNASQKLLELLNREKTDIYFHVAGIGKHNRNLNNDIEQNTLKTNGLGFVNCIDTAYNFFKNQGGGHIAAITSIAGTKGLGAAPSYSATKRMQSTYLQCLAQLSNMENNNIKITDIRPGFIKTNLLDSKRNYPLVLNLEKASKQIFKAVKKQKRIKIIDWKYAIIVFLWKIIPRQIWEKLKIDVNN